MGEFLSSKEVGQMFGQSGLRFQGVYRYGCLSPGRDRDSHGCHCPFRMFGAEVGARGAPPAVLPRGDAQVASESQALYGS